MISISQLCDKGLNVNFTKSGCLVTNEKNEVLMRGVRCKDNYYLWIPQEINCSSTCLLSKDNLIRGTCFINDVELIAIIDTEATHLFICLSVLQDWV